VISQVVDGVDEVRRVAREELRKGADHIKVFISGGVASPTDPIWMPQFTNSELTAAVEEARTRRKYVIAHCHTDDGARRCVEVGIRSIDHATTVSDATAKLIADSGTSYTVPMLAVIHQVTESEIPVMVDVVMRDEDGSDVPQGKPRRHHLSLNSIADIEKIDVGSDHHGIRRLRPVEPRQRPTSRSERHELSAGLLELWRGFVTFCVGRCD
jgi:hypothetical protein